MTLKNIFSMATTSFKLFPTRGRFNEKVVSYRNELITKFTRISTSPIIQKEQVWRNDWEKSQFPVHLVDNSVKSLRDYSVNSQEGIQALSQIPRYGTVYPIAYPLHKSHKKPPNNIVMFQ